MPNWCQNDIIIYHPNEKKLEDFAKKIKKWTSNIYSPNDWNEAWLGNIVGFAGFNPEKILCRGILSFSEIYTSSKDHKRAGKKMLAINTETAWEPMNEMWKKVLDKHLPGCEFIYYANEPMCGLIRTNVPNSYLIEDNENIIYDSFELADAIKEAKTLYNHDSATIEEAMAYLSSKGNITEYEYDDTYCDIIKDKEIELE